MTLSFFIFQITGLGLTSEYINARNAISELHPASSLASADFHFSIDGLNGLNSSRAGSIRASVSRKRALSSSPYSDSFDIGSMIRYSPNSLASLVNQSRSSSASGSYGHLSASALAPALGMHPAMPHLQRILGSGGFLHGLPGHHPPTASMFSLPHHLHPGHSLSKPQVSWETYLTLFYKFLTLSNINLSIFFKIPCKS